MQGRPRRLKLLYKQKAEDPRVSVPGKALKSPVQFQNATLHVDTSELLFFLFCFVFIYLMCLVTLGPLPGVKYILPLSFKPSSKYNLQPSLTVINNFSPLRTSLIAQLVKNLPAVQETLI